MNIRKEVNRFIKGLTYDKGRYVDGFDKDDLRELPQLHPGETCAYRFEKRDSAKIRQHTIPEDEVPFCMPGMVFLADDNLFSSNPTRLDFYPHEVSPITLMSTLPGVGLKTVADPTVGKLKVAVDEMVESCKRKNVTKQIEVYKQVFKTSAGFDISCGYTDVFKAGLGFGAKNNNVCVITLRQKLFHIAPDNVYKKPADYFTDKVDLDSLKEQCNGVAPVYVNKLCYGRKIYIIFSTSDHSLGFDASISVKGVNVSFSNKKQLNKCSISAIMVGATTETYRILNSLDDVENLIKDFVEKAPDAINYAEPIEWELRYLKDNRVVRTHVKPYYIKKVDEVLIDVTGHTSGTLFNSRVFYMEPSYGHENRIVWSPQMVFRKWNSSNRKFLCPARSCCFELNIDKHGDRKGSYDYNIAIPKIPLQDLEYDKNGDLVFEMQVHGALGKKGYKLIPNADHIFNRHSSARFRKIFNMNETLSLTNWPDQTLTQYYIEQY